jgi:hypothetical protein
VTEEEKEQKAYSSFYDTETESDRADIRVNGDGFISCCSEFKYLGSPFVPKLSDTPVVIKQISQARKAFDAMTNIYSATRGPGKRSNATSTKPLLLC